MSGSNTITSANAVFMLAVLPLFPVPQQLQGFMADRAFDTDAVEIAQTVMGVDGVFSAGFIPYPTPQNIHIMPDSPSSIIFETWVAAEKVAQEKFFATATIALPSVGRNYTLQRGVLTRFAPIPGAERVLVGRTFTITWGSIDPAVL